MTVNNNRSFTCEAFVNGTYPLELPNPLETAAETQSVYHEHSLQLLSDLIHDSSQVSTTQQEHLMLIAQRFKVTSSTDDVITPESLARDPAALREGLCLTPDQAKAFDAQVLSDLANLNELASYPSSYDMISYHSSQKAASPTRVDHLVHLWENLIKDLSVLNPNESNQTIDSLCLTLGKTREELLNSLFYIMQTFILPSIAATNKTTAKEILSYIKNSSGPIDTAVAAHFVKEIKNKIQSRTMPLITIEMKDNKFIIASPQIQSPIDEYTLPLKSLLSYIETLPPSIENANCMAYIQTQFLTYSSEIHGTAKKKLGCAVDFITGSYRESSKEMESQLAELARKLNPSSRFEYPAPLALPIVHKQTIRLPKAPNTAPHAVPLTISRWMEENSGAYHIYQALRNNPAVFAITSRDKETLESYIMWHPDQQSSFPLTETLGTLTLLFHYAIAEPDTLIVKALCEEFQILSEELANRLLKICDDQIRPQLSTLSQHLLADYFDTRGSASLPARLFFHKLVHAIEHNDPSFQYNIRLNPVTKHYDIVAPGCSAVFPPRLYDVFNYANNPFHSTASSIYHYRAMLNLHQTFEAYTKSTEHDVETKRTFDLRKHILYTDGALLSEAEKYLQTHKTCLQVTDAQYKNLLNMAAQGPASYKITQDHTDNTLYIEGVAIHQLLTFIEKKLRESKLGKDEMLYLRTLLETLNDQLQKMSAKEGEWDDITLSETTPLLEKRIKNLLAPLEQRALAYNRQISAPILGKVTALQAALASTEPLLFTEMILLTTLDSLNIENNPKTRIDFLKNNTDFEVTFNSETKHFQIGQKPAIRPVQEMLKTINELSATLKQECAQEISDLLLHIYNQLMTFKRERSAQSWTSQKIQDKCAGLIGNGRESSNLLIEHIAKELHSLAPSFEWLFEQWSLHNAEGEQWFALDKNLKELGPIHAMSSTKTAAASSEDRSNPSTAAHSHHSSSENLAATAIVTPHSSEENTNLLDIELGKNPSAAKKELLNMLKTSNDLKSYTLKFNKEDKRFYINSCFIKEMLDECATLSDKVKTKHRREIAATLEHIKKELEAFKDKRNSTGWTVQWMIDGLPGTIKRESSNDLIKTIKELLSVLQKPNQDSDFELVEESEIPEEM